ncbi:hypothetical protein COCMIDRAFT_3604 [Bipolaris oryzae ATCC 44560]|uniref:Uncharacterized protein n=1 Tax=Bipolaris oryzae ATCC 44560 TaxID=930090 RepID=W6ZC09_COCMI|nr:uncharacterized protein COCMIDRAFT_3604 [Bipolaris oryzae ATCC 44560]EUC47515.1 hypothetical protein COCMIDRAFT_3604 [Bipolaris oryzae ATCC 44560]
MLLDNLSGAGLLEPKHLALGLSITTLFTVALARAISLLQNVLETLVSSILNSGSTPEIVISELEHLKKLFKDSALGPGAWFTQLKVLAKSPVPDGRAIANDAALIRTQTRKFVEQLNNSGDFCNGVFDPAKDINFYPFLVVATLLYGDLDAEEIQ